MKFHNRRDITKMPVYFTIYQLIKIGDASTWKNKNIRERKTKREINIRKILRH